MAWIIKTISGWFPNSGKKSGKIVWVAGIAIGVYFLIALCTNVIEHYFPTKPPNTTIQAGGTQIVNQAEPRDMMGIGCNAWRGYGRFGVKQK